MTSHEGYPVGPEPTEGAAGADPGWPPSEAPPEHRPPAGPGGTYRARATVPPAARASASVPQPGSVSGSAPSSAPPGAPASAGPPPHQHREPGATWPPEQQPAGPYPPAGPSSPLPMRPGPGGLPSRVTGSASVPGPAGGPPGPGTGGSPGPEGGAFPGFVPSAAAQPGMHDPYAASRDPYGRPPAVDRPGTPEPHRQAGPPDSYGPPGGHDPAGPPRPGAAPAGYGYGPGPGANPPPAGYPPPGPRPFEDHAGRRDTPGTDFPGSPGAPMSGPPGQPGPAAQTPRGRRRLVIALVAAAVVILLGGVAVVAMTVLNSKGGSYTVGKCVKQDGSKARTIACSESGAFKIIDKVERQDQCPDANQPYVVIERSGGRDEVLCLRPANG